MDTLNSMLCLNEKCSTTRNLSTEKSIIKNHPDDKFETILFLPEIEGRKAEGGLRTQGYLKKSFPDKPLVTVITVVFNSGEYLEDTILSVLNQSYENIEYIIIDGGSTDKTVEIIKNYQNKIDYWVSEPDKGIYDAMNKGISLASGEIISLLNAGDLFTGHQVINSVLKYFYENNCDILAGSVNRYSWDGKLTFPVHKDYSYFSKNVHYTMPVNHPSTFVRKNVYKKVGLYETKYKIAGDYDFVYRAYHDKEINMFLTDQIFVNMLLGGISDQASSVFRRAVESFKLRSPYLSVYKNYFFSLKLYINQSLKLFLKELLPLNFLIKYHEKKS